jgi:hypothetical protein
MLTFSTAPTEATLLPGLINVVNVLPDNTAKEISPKDVRDSIYTLWHNTILKPTTVSASQIKYIGIDQYEIVDSPTGDVIYPKMFFGKKQTGGQFIMNDLLLQTDTDFLFYNTKNNALVGDYNTTIAILAGTGSFNDNGVVKAPTLKSTVVSDPSGSYINLNIENNSYIDNVVSQFGGDINIKSVAGYVSINDFIFPKASDINSSKDGYVLKFKWINGAGAYGVWESAFSQSITDIYYPQGQVTITGDPIVLNGYNFTENTPVPTAVGGIQVGDTFANVNVLDMIRRIVYTYIPPTITMGFRYSYTGQDQTIIEVGDLAFGGPASNGDPNKLRLYYTLTINSTYSIPTQIASLPPTINSDGISLPDGNVLSGSIFPSTPITRNTYYNRVRQLVSSDPDFGQSYKIITYTFSVTDSYPTTRSASAKITAVLPYFYGTNHDLYTTGNQLNGILGIDESSAPGTLNLKLVPPIIGAPTSSNNQNVFINTQGLTNKQGYIYFGYPAQFPPLIDIRDNNIGDGFPVLDQFATYSIKITSQNGRWNDQPYVFYITNERKGPEVSTVPFRFIFATP